MTNKPNLKLNLMLTLKTTSKRPTNRKMSTTKSCHSSFHLRLFVKTKLCPSSTWRNIQLRFLFTVQHEPKVQKTADGRSANEAEWQHRQAEVENSCIQTTKELDVVWFVWNISIKILMERSWKQSLVVVQVNTRDIQRSDRKQGENISYFKVKTAAASTSELLFFKLVN